LIRFRFRFVLRIDRDGKFAAASYVFTDSDAEIHNVKASD
jgi:hypothetical protein